jgi:hypothetical protein
MVRNTSYGILAAFLMLGALVPAQAEAQTCPGLTTPSAGHCVFEPLPNIGEGCNLRVMNLGTSRSLTALINVSRQECDNLTTTAGTGIGIPVDDASALAELLNGWDYGTFTSFRYFGQFYGVSAATADEVLSLRRLLYSIYPPLAFNLGDDVKATWVQGGAVQAPAPAP